ncbi:hypothetical protein DUI87_07320 [Hirundo rustica rustica]|uniref:Uncharacterized protein n=1 Tax=Hirundo rustica rustica TaxID=333673 RepID=A0A3M0KPL5_HIRRU|nr:hypothetical protein DUI87_07320 [Hirundo rustica rustica]
MWTHEQREKYQYSSGADPQESSSAENDLGVLGDDKLTMRWQRPHSLGGQWYPGMHWEERRQQIEGGDPAPLLSPSEAPSGELCAVLGSSAQERQGATGEGQHRGTEVFRGLENLLQEETGGLRRLRGHLINTYKYLINTYKYLKGSCQEYGAFSPCLFSGAQ